MFENQLGIFSLPAKLALSNREGVAYVKQMGWKAFEPGGNEDLLENDFAEARYIGAMAKKEHIHFPSLSVVSDMFWGDAQAEVERLKRFADAAAVMGATYLHHTLVPSLNTDFCTVPFDKVLKQVVPKVREVYDYASKQGVHCVYEDQGFYFNGVEHFRIFLEMLDRPAGVVLDTGNIAFAGENALDFAKHFLDRIVHVHLKDYQFSHPLSEIGKYSWRECLEPVNIGMGDIQMKDTLKLLEDNGYTGYLMLEHGQTIEEQVKSLQWVQIL